MVGFEKHFRMLHVILLSKKQPSVGELENFGRKTIWIEQTNNIHNKTVIFFSCFSMTDQKMFPPRFLQGFTCGALPMAKMWDRAS